MFFQKENGSALFLVLIAVALFAALSYAVSVSGRGGGTISSETALLAASGIVQRSALIKQNVLRMTLTGIPLSQMSFENSAVSGYINAGCSTNDCKVFSSDNVGNYFPPSGDWLDSSLSGQANYGEYVFSARTCIINYPNPDPANCWTSDAMSDLVMIIPYVKKEICIEINKNLGVSNPGGNPPIDSGCSWSGSGKYTGSFTATYGIGDIPAGALYNKETGCYQSTALQCVTRPDHYVFFQALYGR